jgi:hypothetical protein
VLIFLFVSLRSWKQFSRCSTLKFRRNAQTLERLIFRLIFRFYSTGWYHFSIYKKSCAIIKCHLRSKSALRAMCQTTSFFSYRIRTTALASSSRFVAYEKKRVQTKSCQWSDFFFFTARRKISSAKITSGFLTLTSLVKPSMVN